MSNPQSPEEGKAPATPPAATTSGKAVATKPAVTTLRDLITGDSMKRQFEAALPKVLNVNRFVRCLVTTMNRTPALMDCDRNSVLAGAMTAAQLGLEIDPSLGRAYLIPYNDNKKGKVAQFIIGYKGLIDLAYRSGQVSGITAEAVYEKDFFQYEHGLDPILKHVPSNDEDRGPLKFAYAICFMKNGGKAWRVLNRAQVMKHRKSSSSAGSSYSPWNSHEEEMWIKTAVRALSSRIPQSPELIEAVAKEDEPYDIGGMPSMTDAVISNNDSGADGLAGAVQG